MGRRILVGGPSGTSGEVGCVQAPALTKIGRKSDKIGQNRTNGFWTFGQKSDKGQTKIGQNPFGLQDPWSQRGCHRDRTVGGFMIP